MKALVTAALLIGTTVSISARADNEPPSLARKILDCRISFGKIGASKEPASVIAAKARAQQRAVERAASGESVSVEDVIAPATPHVSVEGLEVREFDGTAPEGFVPVTPEEFIRIYGETDRKKIIKAKELPPTAVKAPSADSKKWYRSILDLGNGHFDSVNYTIIETKPSGKLVIRFENPLNRGRIETKEVRPSDLQRGLKELDAPPKNLNSPDAL